MKIAQIAPLFESVPPKLYGGAERVVHHLTEELVRQGHDVTLFASGDSMTSARLVSCSKTALRLNPAVEDPIPYHVMMIEQVRRRAEIFDILHFHIDLLHFPVIRSFADRTLTTLHGRLDLPDLKPFYELFPDIPLVSISDNQREPMPPVNWVGTVHHGLAPDVLPFNGHPKGDYLAFLGRVSPEKRPDRAIEIADRVNLPLRIAAKIDKVDEHYWRSEVEPLVQRSANAKFIGEINEQQKAEFLGNARALLFPIDWPEPFGLVMIEAMACGTPVVAFRCGSVPEIIDDGVSGFVVDSMEEAVKAVQTLDSIDRRAVRATFEERFTARRMASDYLDIYRGLAGERQKVMSIPAMSDSGFGTDFTEVV